MSFWRTTPQYRAPRPSLCLSKPRQCLQVMRIEQNLNDLPIPVVVMLAARNRRQELQPLVPQVITVLSGTLHRRIYQVST